MRREEKYQVLENLGVHNLRHIAHQWGVKSPTSKKKEQLIDDIIARMKGETQPVNTKAGRKYKNAFMGDGFIQDFIPQDIKNIMPKKLSDVRFSDVGKDAKILDNAKCKRISGFLSKSTESYYIVDQDSVICHVPSIQVVQHGLYNGDKIECEGYPAEKDFFSISKVISVNGVNVEELDRTNHIKFDNYQKIENPMIVDDITEGFPAIKHIKFPNILTAETLETVQKFKNQGFKVLLLSVGLSYSQFLNMDNSIFDDVFIGFSEKDASFSIEKFNSAVNHARNLACSGHKVLLVVSAIEYLYNEVEMYFDYTDGAKAKNELMKKFLALPRGLSNGGSVTVFALSYQPNRYDLTI